ncbi:MAG TPA: hypothetical protein VJ743_08185 [Albitalea sp.]|nr:hypothetical protein [Albitalea sp.]
MRASPALQIGIRRFGLWRGFVVVLLATGAAATAAWMLAVEGALPDGLVPVAVLGAAAACLLASRLLRCPPLSLRWDTQNWHLGPFAKAGEEPWAGDLSVAIDLGSWLMLRFVHEITPGRRRVHWLPVQRAGLEAQWHALRCAVYCARPVQGRDPGSSTSIRPESQE